MVLLLEGVDGRDGDRLLEFAEPSNRCTCDENVNKDVGPTLWVMMIEMWMRLTRFTMMMIRW